ncbi:MAG TPA: hypothetical protein VFE01_01955, partial [Terracidiphilus sp.]|nr:hypothetical protein [Terracidiphilus sp.]
AIAAVLALAYLVVYSALNWRTCTEHAYCGSVGFVVMETLKTRTASCYFGAALFSFAAAIVDTRAKEVRSQLLTPVDSAGESH